MMNSTERIISFHRRQTIHLFHFGSSCHIQNMIFIKMSTELHGKRFLLSHFLPLSTQCSFVYVARANQIWCRTHIQQRRREKRTQHKKLKMHFFKTFPKSFCARYERNIYNFCSNISCDCERKKNRHFVYKSRKLREKTEKMHWSGRSSRHSRTESSSSSVAKKMTRNSNFGVFNENKGRCTITLVFTSLFLTF